MKWLNQDMKKKIYFVTNSDKSRKMIQDKFKKYFRIIINLKNIYTSSYAVAEKIKEKENKNEIKELAYVIGKSGILDELKEHHIDVKQEDHNEKKYEDFRIDDVDPNITSVVCGFDSTINAYKIAYASSCLRYNKNCQFFVTCPDQHHVSCDGSILPGTASYWKPVQCATNIDPVVAGKPNPFLMEKLIKDHHLESKKENERIVMIGDTIETDVHFGKNNTVSTLLVLSGTTKEKDLDYYYFKENNNKPDFIIDNIFEIFRLY